MKDSTMKSAVDEFERALEESSMALKVASRFAKSFPSSEALNKYLQAHPNADARAHSVARPQDKTDEDKLMADLQSRAKHNKRQDKKEKAKPDEKAEG